MPIYEYRCSGCDTGFEELVRSPGAAVACPDCGSAEVERMLSTFAGVGRRDAALPSHPRFAAPSRGGCGPGCGCGHGH